MARIEELARLAEQVVAAFTAGEPYLPTVAELFARCEDAGIEHAAVLNIAARRAEHAA